MREILSRPRRRLHAELPADFAQSHECIRVCRNLVVVDEPLVEPRRLPCAEHIAYEVQVIGVGVPVFRNVPDLVNSCLRHAILHLLPVRPGHLRDPCFLVCHRRPRGNVPEILFRFLFRGFRVNVSGQNEDDIGRPVIRLEPFLHVLHGRRIQIGHLPDCRPRIRMSRRISVLRDQLAGDAVRLVFSLALLVLYHAALQIKRFLIQRAQEVPHAVGFHPERQVQRRSGHILEVIRAVRIRRAVQIRGADSFHRINVPPGGVFAAAEHQVFEKMRESRFPRPLVL